MKGQVLCHGSPCGGILGERLLCLFDWLRNDVNRVARECRACRLLMEDCLHELPVANEDDFAAIHHGKSAYHCIPLASTL